ncbi:MAG: diacylglycerol kinase family lipid kinase [Chloroflexi bacterium]|nr:diacylglycerol kinase family lipid kinase [Chloroflexota bacterium]
MSSSQMGREVHLLRTSERPGFSVSTAPHAPTAWLVVNPVAGPGARSSVVERIADAANALGWRVDVRETEAPGHATRIAAEAALMGISVVLVAGGDGTLNEVVQGLAGTATAVGPLPLGTVNVWARELGLSHDPIEAVRQLLAGQIRRIDLGKANGRYFILMAGLGFDAQAMEAVKGAPKRRFGPFAVLAAGVVAALRTRGAWVKMRADGRYLEHHAALITVGNTRLWAGAVAITFRATAADGALDVYVFPGQTLLAKLRHLGLVLIRQHDRDPDITYLRVRTLSIAARPPLPLQVDGEPHGTTPVRIEVVPGAVRVLVGAGTAHALADAPIEVPSLAEWTAAAIEASTDGGGHPPLSDAYGAI